MKHFYVAIATWNDLKKVLHINNALDIVNRKINRENEPDDDSLFPVARELLSNELILWPWMGPGCARNCYVQYS